MRNKRVLSIVAALGFAGALFAATPYATVVYAEGSSFTLIRGGKSMTVRVDDPTIIGLEVKPGDIIRTGSSTFIEIAINPLSASVQIAENTSFRCDADETGLTSTGELFYGRVRAKVAKLSGNATYRMSSPSLTAGVRGTDFGLDVLAIRQTGSASNGPSSPAPKGGSPMLYRVFCFEGKVLVGSASGTMKDTLEIDGNEMVERVSASGAASANAAVTEPPLEKKRVTGDVVDFWKVHPFAVISRLPFPVTAPSAGNASGGINPDAVRYAEPIAPSRAKMPKAGAIALVGLGTLTCAFTAYWSTQRDSDARFIEPAYAAGTIMIGSGMVIALASLLSE
jgi:hypothetical protein